MPSTFIYCPLRLIDPVWDLFQLEHPLSKSYIAYYGQEAMTSAAFLAKIRPLGAATETSRVGFSGFRAAKARSRKCIATHFSVEMQAFLKL